MSKHALQELLEEVGIECQSYSGRAMYGEKCLGISLQNASDFGILFSKLAQAMFDMGVYSWNEIEGEDPEAIQKCKDIVQCFRSYRQDSLGRGYIVYFPDVPFTGEGNE